jgi:hypothetical protein
MPELEFRPPKDEEQSAAMKNPPFCCGEHKAEERTCPRSEKREESFTPVEITGAWVRAEKGIGGELFWGGLRRGPSILRMN